MWLIIASQCSDLLDAPAESPGVLVRPCAEFHTLCSGGSAQRYLGDFWICLSLFTVLRVLT